MLVLTLRERLCYGIGACAFGVKDCGFSYWLLIFYNQSLGLPAERASLALFIALLFDAVADVAIGHFSDNLDTRCGRRHPLMYASAVPIALLHAALWSPPASALDSEDRLFAYLAGMAVLVRFFVSLNEIPQVALVAELTSSYDERTAILSVRYFFGWLGGLSMTVLLQGALLHPSADGKRDAFLDVHGFQTFGQIGSAVMLGTTIASAAGLHRLIPHLRGARTAQGGDKSPKGGGKSGVRHAVRRALAEVLRPRLSSYPAPLARAATTPRGHSCAVGFVGSQVRGALSNRSLASLLCSSLLSGMASGLSSNLWAFIRAAHGALPHHVPSPRCTADPVHHVWHRPS